MFTIPENLKDFSVAGLTDLYNIAKAEHATLLASANTNADAVSDDDLTRLEQLQAFLIASAAELQQRIDRSKRLTASNDIPELPQPEAPAEPAVVAAAEPVKDVAATTVVADVAGTTTSIVEATVVAAGTEGATRAVPVTVGEVAPYSPAPEPTVNRSQAAPYTIVASTDLATIPTGTELDWKGVGKAFVEKARPFSGMAKGRVTGRHQLPVAMIRRDYPANQILAEGDSDEGAYLKLRDASDAYARNAVVAANGWCAPSEPDYSICNPIATDGLLNLPEMVLRRGGLIHNKGLDFGDFFGDDFVLPIPGYNILTEAQVIADTAKTCLEIPCPTFVDDRLNVAALCLTSSLLQNVGYPEFVSEFVQGAIAAMAHLVNREVINAIVTASTAVDLSTVDPWQGDGTFWSNILSAVEFAIEDLRRVYRSSMNQRFTVVLPEWVRAGMRADYVRGNARANNDLADGEIMSALSLRGAEVQWVYDWQDAFNPGTIPAGNQLGAATPPTGLPTSLQFLVFLPGTWVLGRQDVIRLDTVYDSTNLQQNLVTQLFMEDGFKPMQMCQHSRVYTLPVCPTGSTGAQRAIDCTNV